MGRANMYGIQVGALTIPVFEQHREWVKALRKQAERNNESLAELVRRVLADHAKSIKGTAT